MSIGTVVAIKPGKVNATALYIRLKGKAVYRYPTPLDTRQQASLLQRIRDAHNRVRLKNWVKVR